MGSGVANGKDAGIIPRVMQEIFKRMEEADEKPVVRVSFMELYKEELRVPPLLQQTLQRSG